jgi:Tol biopolymer transport system component
MTSRIRSPGALTPLIAQPGVYTAPRVSPDGSRIAYTAAGNKDGDLWVHDLRRDTPTQLTFTRNFFDEIRRRIP